MLTIVGTINDPRVKKRLEKYKSDYVRLVDNKPWSELPSLVASADIVPVLQDTESKISDFQIPAKLTDALALNVPVIGTLTPTIDDLAAKGALNITTYKDLVALLREALLRDTLFKQQVKTARTLYLSDFTYAVNAARIKSAVDEAAAIRVGVPEALRPVVRSILRASGLQALPDYLKEVASPGLVKGKIDVVFFWKQNDSDLYGRRPDMIVKYLIESGRVGKVLHFDRPLSIGELNQNVDRSDLAKYHEGNYIYMNTVRRILKIHDSGDFFRRTFVYRGGQGRQDFLGRELPMRDSYLDFILDEMRQCGLDHDALAWVCPTVFDFPEIHRAVGFKRTVVDIVDDQRKFGGRAEYKERVSKNYEDILPLGNVVLANCRPVVEGFASLRPDIKLVPNGAEMMDSDVRPPLPIELKALPRPIVGYVGNLRDRVDVKLIRASAEQHPDWSFVLIGSARGAPDVLSLGELKNVHLLGLREYETPKAFIRHFDVAMMPHLATTLSENMNPLKLYVYLAAGVPIVCTKVANIEEVAPYAYVAEDALQFQAYLKDAIQTGPKKAVAQEQRSAVLAGMSWSKRVSEALDLVGMA